VSANFVSVRFKVNFLTPDIFAEGGRVFTCFWHLISRNCACDLCWNWYL